MLSEQITSRFWVAWLHFMLNYILRLVELLSSLSTCVWEDADRRPPLCKFGVTGSTFRMSYFCWLSWPLSTLKQVQYDLTFQLLSFFSLSLYKSLEGADFIKIERHHTAFKFHSKKSCLDISSQILSSISQNVPHRSQFVCERSCRSKNNKLYFSKWK